MVSPAVDATETILAVYVAIAAVLACVLSNWDFRAKIQKFSAEARIGLHKNQWLLRFLLGDQVHWDRYRGGRAHESNCQSTIGLL